MLQVGTTVILKDRYLRLKTEEFRRAFSGNLTVVAVEGDRIKLTNDRSVGLTTVHCYKNQVHIKR